MVNSYQETYKLTKSDQIEGLLLVCKADVQSWMDSEKEKLTQKLKQK